MKIDCMQKLMNLKKHEFVINIQKIFTANILAQLITILISPIITRLFLPSDFGISSFYASIISVFGVFVTFGFDQAIILPKKNQEAYDITSLSTISCVLVVLILIPLCMIPKKILLMIGFDEKAVMFIWIIPIAVLLRGINSILISWCNREKKFGAFSISKIVTTSTGAALKISHGFLFGSNALALIFGRILGTFSGSVFLFLKTRNIPVQIIKNFKLSRLKRALIIYKDFPVYAAPTRFISSLSQNLPIFVLGHYFDSSVIGLYAFANNILRMPIVLLGDSIRKVFLQKAAEYYGKKEINKLSELYVKSTIGLIVVGLIPFALLFLYGEELFSFIFGLNWSESGKYAQYLSVWLFFLFINPPSRCLYTVFRMQKYLFHYTNITIFIRIIFLLGGAVFFNDPIYSIILYSLSGVFINIYFIVFIYVKIVRMKDKL